MPPEIPASPSRTRAARPSALLGFALLACAGFFTFLYLVVAVRRMGYPFELEWMEGSFVDEAARLLAGQRLYVSPSLSYVPYLYTPLYFYLSALVAAVTGIGFLPLRLVSFAASVGCLAFIGSIAGRQAHSWPAGLLAAGLFTATYRLSGLWFDLARVDSTYLCFLLGAAYLVKYRRGGVLDCLAGACVALAFLSKQTALPMALPMVLYCFLVSPRTGLRVAGTAAALIVLSTMIFNLASEGWYGFYVFGIASGHPLVREMLLGFWRDDLARALPAASLIALCYLLDRRTWRCRLDGLYFLALAAGLIGGSWGGRLNMGGYLNVLMPAYAAIAILCALMVTRALAAAESPVDGVRFSWEPRTFAFALGAACLLQFALLAYNPASALPTTRDLAAGRQFVAALAAMPGDVYVPFHGYLPTLAGKRAHAHAMATADLVHLGPDSPVKSALVAEFEGAVAARTFDAVVLDQNAWEDWLPGDIEQTYQQQGPVGAMEDSFWPVTGMYTRPEQILVPKN